MSGLETVFVGTAGSGPLTVGICAEYDVTPGIGHACGHNIIATAAAGAGMALARAARIDRCFEAGALATGAALSPPS